MQQRIVPYKHDWVERFHGLAAQIRQELPPNVGIEHYGSTSVPGLSARPIVDIQITVADINERAAFEPALARLGFVQSAPADLQDLAADGMLFYVPEDGSNTVHLAVCQRDGTHHRRQLAVRDYLRAHPAAAHEYELIKRRSVAAARGDRDAYARGKADFLGATACAGAQLDDASRPKH